VSPTEPARAKPSLRIEQLAITNFRAFRERTVIPFGGPGAQPDAVVVLHGDNGTGKSNALDALNLFVQTAALALLGGDKEGDAVVPWDAEHLFHPGLRPIVLAYQDRPHGSEGAMEVEVSFADSRLGRIRSTCTPSGNHVRVRLERSSSAPGEGSTEDAWSAPTAGDERDQLATWLTTPRGPGSAPLTILDARRRAQWGASTGHRSLMVPEIAEGLFSLRTSRRPEERNLWREFVALLDRFGAFHGKEVSMERPAGGQGPAFPDAPPAPEVVVEEPGRAVLGLDDLSSGEQQVVVLVAMSLLSRSSVLVIQEPEISLDIKNQRLLRAILDEVAARGVVDQVILESHVPTFDGAEVVRFARRADGTSAVTRAAAAGETRREIARKAREQGAEQRWITPDGYTQIPDNMRNELRLGDGGHVWFVKGTKHWEAWPETELDELFGAGDEDADDG
jgi:hypothetical protein